jgi:hypothetical protein
MGLRLVSGTDLMSVRVRAECRWQGPWMRSESLASVAPLPRHPEQSIDQAQMNLWFPRYLVRQLVIQLMCLFKFQVPTSSGKTWHAWQEDVLQLTLASRSPAGRQDLGTAVSGVNLLVSATAHPARPWDPRGSTHQAPSPSQGGESGGLALSPQLTAC